MGAAEARVGYAPWLGVVLCAIGFLSYFFFFARFPSLRDFPWVNLPLVLLGLALSGLGLRRALGSVGHWPTKVLAALGLAFSLTVTGLFCLYVFVLSSRMPDPAVKLVIGQPAPAFTLPDQTGSPTRLADFRGKKVVLVFFRGPW